MSMVSAVPVCFLSQCLGANDVMLLPKITTKANYHSTHSANTSSVFQVLFVTDETVCLSLPV